MSDERAHSNNPISLNTDPEKEYQQILDAKENPETKRPAFTVTSRASSVSSVGLSLKSPRTARFAEATSVNSPIDGHNPFSDPPRTRHLMPQPQPSDVGFGYMSDQQASKHNSYAGVEVPLTPKSPLKSALKVPGTPARQLNPLSPTFKEEQVLEKHEGRADKANAKDLVSRIKAIRVAVLTWANRKSRPASVLLRWHFEASASAVVSSFLPCSPPHSRSSTRPATSRIEINFLRGHPVRRFGLRLQYFVSLASRW